MYGSNKRPVRDTAKLAQRVRQLESQRVREEEVSKCREDEITALKSKLEALVKKQKTNSSLGPTEDARLERADMANPPMPGCVGPRSLSLPPHEVPSKSSEISVVAPPEEVLSSGLCPRPVPKPRKTFAGETLARTHTQSQSTTVVDALAVVKLLCALSFVLSSRPAGGGLPPPLQPTVPTPTLAVDPFLKWSDPDPGKIGVDSLIML